MSNIAIFKTGKTPQYLKSVNTPDYSGDPDVLVNPDISLLDNVSLKYWKRVGDLIEEMTVAEKQAITNAELEHRKSVADDYGIDMKIALTALIKVINLRLPSDKKITKQEMIIALKGEIN